MRTKSQKKTSQEIHRIKMQVRDRYMEEARALGWGKLVTDHAGRGVPLPLDNVTIEWVTPSGRVLTATPHWDYVSRVIRRT